MTKISYIIILLLSIWYYSAVAFTCIQPWRSRSATQGSPLFSDYLSSLSFPSSSSSAPSTTSNSVGIPTITEPPKTSPTVYEGDHDQNKISFSHAPFSYFTIDKLTPKGPRKNADVGLPHDASRNLATVGSASAGTWWCAKGGWPSPVQRATTEVFFVFSGYGCLTDADGTRHYFGPGDTVILPKGWSGRWDVLEDIHKVWVVHDHPNIEDPSIPIRAIITHYSSFAPQFLSPPRERSDATHGSSPRISFRTFYDQGPTKVGCWECTPGSFPVISNSGATTTECFHVLEGVFFLTGADGNARRCVAGDTVVLPKGWTGSYDVIETTKKLWVAVE